MPLKNTTQFAVARMLAMGTNPAVSSGAMPSGSPISFFIPSIAAVDAASVITPDGSLTIDGPSGDTATRYSPVASAISGAVVRSTPAATSSAINCALSNAVMIYLICIATQ